MCGNQLRNHCWLSWGIFLYPWDAFTQIQPHFTSNPRLFYISADLNRHTELLSPPQHPLLGWWKEQSLEIWRQILPKNLFFFPISCVQSQPGPVLVTAQASTNPLAASPRKPNPTFPPFPAPLSSLSRAWHLLRVTEPPQKFQILGWECFYPPF